MMPKKMNKEKPLSEKVFCDIHRGIESNPKIFAKHVAEAVKKLKELKGIKKHKTILKEIDKIFGSFKELPVTNCPLNKEVRG